MSLTLASTDALLPDPIPVGLARYSDRREIARGGNGILQAGYDLVIGRTVAIKMLLPEYRDSRLHARRLLREARVTAQLQHPGTVAVYEIGDDPDVGVYYVMKRISGENFFDVLRGFAQDIGSSSAGNSDAANVQGDDTVAMGYRRAFPLRRRIEVMREVCLTLAYAHARGIVHRDVKPANIWVGNFGEVVLLDWGAAKVWGQSSHPTNSAPGRRRVVPESPSRVAHREGDFGCRDLTVRGELVGTPTYMSPEQIAGGSIDERSDVFSAGICLYEAIAIREPFRGVDQEETFDNICSRQPVPPSERSPQRGIPPLADQVVSHAIAKQPAARFQSMRELITALDELLDAVVDDQG